VHQGHVLGPRPARPAGFGLHGGDLARLARAYPRAILAWAIVGVPLVFVAAILPAPLSWVGWLTAYTIAAGAAIAATSGPGPSLRSGVATALGLVAPLGLAGVLLGGALVAVVAPMILIVSALEAGPFGAYLVLLATVAILARLPLMLPAIVVRGMPALDALELSWDLVDGVLVEIAALVTALVVAALVPVVAAATVAGTLGLPSAATLLLASVALAVFGPALPLASAALLDPLEARRRAIDPTFGRP
jgi:hypothetical protein